MDGFLVKATVVTLGIVKWEKGKHCSPQCKLRQQKQIRNGSKISLQMSYQIQQLTGNLR